MARLIDADAFVKCLERMTKTAYPNLFPGLLEAIDYVKDFPTVDAVILPCRIGDKVYRIDKGNFFTYHEPFVQELTVTEISWKKEKYGDKDLGFAIIADGIRYKFSSVGKSVFLTREEAEKALGERCKT